MVKYLTVFKVLEVPFNPFFSFLKLICNLSIMFIRYLLLCWRYFVVVIIQKSTKMKKIIFICLTVLSMNAIISCEKEALIESPQEVVAAKILGEWHMYRDENLESIIDQWTGTEWTYVDKWFQNTREDSQIIREFKIDGTFIDRYADVEVSHGTWGSIDEKTYYFDYIIEGNTNQDTIDLLTPRRSVTVYCDNTYSVEIEGNDRTIAYYKIIDSTECSEFINYNVD
jgi:hypothetical protein